MITACIIGSVCERFGRVCAVVRWCARGSGAGGVVVNNPPPPKSTDLGDTNRPTHNQETHTCPHVYTHTHNYKRPQRFRQEFI